MAFPLKPGEQLIATHHEAEILLAKPVLIMFVALFVVWFFAIKYDVTVQLRTWLLLWTLIVSIYTLRRFLMWWFNQYIITTERLIKVLHDGVFKRVVVETPLDRILNISYKTTGIPSVLFGYGNVDVQVVGLMEPMTLKNIKHPQAIKDYLWRLHQDHAGRSEYSNEEISRIQEKIGYTKNNQKTL